MTFADSSIIEDNIIISVTNSWGDVHPSYGIYADAGANNRLLDIRITGNVIENVNETTISFDSGTNSYILGCQVYNNWINGYKKAVRFNGDYTRSCIVSENTIGTWRKGTYENENCIELRGTWQNFVISDNVFDDVAKFCISTEGTGDGGTISGNQIETNNADFVIYNTGNNIIISNNALTGTTGGTKISSGGAYCEVIGNTGTRGGISVSGTGSEAAHNT